MSGLLEAWGGFRCAPVHLVEWPLGRDYGAALCGEHLEDVALYPRGSAARVRVQVCRRCQMRLEGRMTPPPARRQRRIWP